MGYSCPVCGDPQADDVHLADHLAFTALVRGGDHEAWLDERVPDWDQYDSEGLAELVVEHAERTEYPQVFEDTTGNSHDHAQHEDSGTDRGRATDRGITDGISKDLSGIEGGFDGDLDEDARQIVQEAREMTRRRRQNADDENDG